MEDTSVAIFDKNFTPEVKEKASIYVPAIGKVTIVVLLRNLLRIVQNKQARFEAAAKHQDAPVPVTIQNEQPVVNGISS